MCDGGALEALWDAAEAGCAVIWGKGSSQMSSVWKVIRWPVRWRPSSRLACLSLSLVPTAIGEFETDGSERR
mgnify:CR=1 FL=1